MVMLFFFGEEIIRNCKHGSVVDMSVPGSKVAIWGTVIPHSIGNPYIGCYINLLLGI